MITVQVNNAFTRMRRLDSITSAMDMNLGQLQMLKDKEARCAAVHGSQRV